MRKLSAYQILAFITRAKTKKAHAITTNFKISALAWNDKLEWPYGSYSVSDIQDYIEYVLKKYGEDVDKPSVGIYRTKLKIGLHLKLKMDIAFSF